MTDSSKSGRTLLQKIRHVLVGTEHVVVRTAANVAAVTALIAFAVHLLDGGGPSPTPREASFLQASVQSGVFLEQFERETQPVDTGYTSKSTATAGGTRADISLVAFRSAETAPSSTTSLGSAAVGAVGNPEQEREEAEKLAQEAKLKQARAQSEADKQQEEAHQKEQHSEKAPVAGSTTQEHERLQNVDELRQQAKTESEDAHQKTSEAKKIEQEETHPSSGAPRSLPPTPLHREGDAEVAVGTSAPQRTIAAVVNKSGVPVPDTCLQTCAISPAIDKALSEYAANSDEAARQLASIFHDSRQGVFEHKREPFGVTVSYNIDFVGYEGHLLVLSWSLCSTQTGRPLPREWWRNMLAEQIKPTSNKATTPGIFWAPVPPTRGHFYFRLRVFDGGSEVAHARTKAFQ